MGENSQPLVSVVLCTYNGQAHLLEQLQSLARQDYNNVEIICSDNGSTDGTFEILTEWCSKHSSRKLVTCTEQGMNNNFFSAIQYVTGEYIIFCDQDDIWSPEKISRLVRFHEANKMASLVYCLSKPFSTAAPADWNIKHGVRRLEGTEIRKTLLISHTLGHNICITKKMLQEIPVPGNETVAYDWWITVSAMCLGKIVCLREVLTLWRKHDSNTTTQLNSGLFYISRINYLEQFLQNRLIPVLDREWIKEAINQFETLKYKKFSFVLFIFILKNAPFVFFYKTKTNPFAKWLSFTKWAFRMSHRKFTVS